MSEFTEMARVLFEDYANALYYTYGDTITYTADVVNGDVSLRVSEDPRSGDYTRREFIYPINGLVADRNHNDRHIQIREVALETLLAHLYHSLITDWKGQSHTILFTPVHISNGGWIFEVTNEDSEVVFKYTEKEWLAAKPSHPNVDKRI